MNRIECKSLTKGYSSLFNALDDITVSIPEGKIVGLLGPNGSGKSTLIKLIAGLLVPTKGEVLINESVPNAKTKSIVSYLPDKDFLSTWMKVSQLLNYYQDFFEDFDYAKANEMLARMNISVNQKLVDMSKGTREKVQLIMVMSRKAEVYLLDEPIAAVDPSAREFILTTIIKNYSENATMLLSTHLISEVETILDDVMFIKQGQLIKYCSVDSLREMTGKSVNDYFKEEFKC